MKYILLLLLLFACGRDETTDKSVETTNPTAPIVITPIVIFQPTPLIIIITPQPTPIYSDEIRYTTWDLPVVKRECNSNKRVRLLNEHCRNCRPDLLIEILKQLSRGC